jgi:predicted ATPase
MNTPIVIAVTGGPCAGKTTVMEVAKRDLEAEGWTVCVVPEAATILFSQGFTHRGKDFWDCCKRQSCLLRLQIVLEYSMMIHLWGNEKSIILCDRGVFDNKAYMTGEMWQEVVMSCFPNDVVFDGILARYSGVLHLVSAAVGAPEHYKNNEVRKETVQEAHDLDLLTRAAWVGHPNRIIIHNENDGFEGKVSRAIFAIRSLVEETMKRRDEIG